MCAQYVRPGSGALVVQTRWRDHWIDPSSVGIHGTYHSAGMRRPSVGNGTRQPEEAAAAKGDAARGSGQDSGAEPFARSKDGAAGATADDGSVDVVGGPVRGPPSSRPAGLSMRARRPATAPLHHHLVRVRPEVPTCKPSTPRAPTRKVGRPAEAASSATSETGSFRRPYSAHGTRQSEGVADGVAEGAVASPAAAPAAASAAPGAALSDDGSGGARHLALERATAPSAAPPSAALEAPPPLTAAEKVERAAKAAARTAAMRVAAGQSVLASRVASNTVVSDPEGIAERVGSPREGRAQLLKHAELCAAGGALVARPRSGRVVPAWFANRAKPSLALGVDPRHLPMRIPTPR